ncbi:MAG: DUF3810 family protein, partial [Bacteroidota bacterium]
MQKYRTFLITIILLIVSLLLRFWLTADQIEMYYSRGIFVAIRTVWDTLATWLPIPLFYLFWLFVLTLVLGLYRAAKRVKGSFWLKLGFVTRQLIQFAAILVIVFLWGWGYNYGRVAVEEKMGFAPYSLTKQELQNRVFGEAVALSALRNQVVGSDTNALNKQHFPVKWEASIRPLLVSALKKEGYPTSGRVRGRQLWPKGILLRWSTAGVYWPWAGEGNIDGGLHPLQIPSVMAHEMAHGYGFGDEGTCNFWAFLAGQHTNEPVLQYAFRLAYWRRIASRFRRADPEAYDQFRKTQLDRGIINDLRAIYANNNKYPDLLPAVRDATYNAYLKAQGIEEGILNYGRVVQLV